MKRAFLALLLFCLPLAAADSKTAQAEKELVRLSAKIRNGTLPSDDLRWLRRQLEKPLDPEFGEVALILLAEQEARSGKVAQGLASLLPAALLDASVAKAAERALLAVKPLPRQVDGAGRRGWQTEMVSAFSKAVQGTQHWRGAEGSHPRAQLWAALLLAELGEQDQSSRLGQRYRECQHPFLVIGDCCLVAQGAMSGQKFAAARDAANEGLRLIGLLPKVMKGDDTTVQASALELALLGLLHDRLTRLRNLAAPLAEMQARGLPWNLYRDAETLRLAQRPAEAVIIYDELAKWHGDTVFGLAARLYRGKCLLQLAQLRPDATLRRGRDKAAKLAPLHVTEAGLASREQTPETIAVERRERLPAIPWGEEAEKTALRELEAFIAEAPTGLYREEAYLALADQALTEFAPSKARPWLEKGVACLDQLAGKAADASMAVPDSASDVARPAPGYFSRDIWGNKTIAANPPGSVFNRLNCSWYLDAMRIELQGKLGLCQFIAGENAEAGRNWAKLRDLTPEWQEAERSASPSAPRRLAWASEHGMMLTPKDEWRFFGKEQLVRLLVCDYLHFMGRWPDARAQLDAFLAADRDLKPEAKARLLYNRGKTFVGLKERSAEWSKTLPFAGTPAMKQALINIAQQASQNYGSDNRDNATIKDDALKKMLWLEKLDAKKEYREDILATRAAIAFTRRQLSILVENHDLLVKEFPDGQGRWYIYQLRVIGEKNAWPKTWDEIRAEQAAKDVKP